MAVPDRPDPLELGDREAPAWTMRAMPSPQADDDQEIWLLSYSDLVTLLFSVFVMLLAITTLKDQLPKDPAPPLPPAQISAVVERAPVSTPPVPAPIPVPAEARPADDRPRLDPDQVAVESPALIRARWRQRLAELGMPAMVAVEVDRDRVDIAIGAAFLFPSGQADLSARGRAVLARLAPVLAATPGELMVEGHTDSVPIASARYPSNWELSAVRAAAVVRALVDLGLPPARLSAVGYADTRPLAEGTDPDSLARNRRVTLSLQAAGGALPVRH